MSYTKRKLFDNDSDGSTVPLLNYKKYVALLSQEGTDDPLAGVLENTLGGTLTWVRTGVGTYELQSSIGEFANNRTVVFITIDNTAFVEAYRSSPTTVAVDTQDVLGVAVDGKMITTSIEIRVYL